MNTDEHRWNLVRRCATRRVILDTDDRHPRTSIIRISNSVDRSTLPEHPFFILCTSVFI